MLQSKVKEPKNHQDADESDLYPEKQPHSHEAKQDDFLIEISVGVHRPQFANLTQQVA